MRKEFSDPVPQGLLTKEDHLLHAVFLDGANEPFRVGIRKRGQLHRIRSVRRNVFKTRRLPDP